MTGTRTFGALLCSAMLLFGSTASARQRFGVFGTINGKKFKARSDGTPGDNCVNGTYEASGGVVFAALECRGRGKHKRSKKNPKVLAFACGVLSQPNEPPPTPPFEAICLSAGYTEFRSGRFGIPVSMKEWLATVMLQGNPDGSVTETSPVKIRIDSFDGTYVRGVFYGVFDQPQPPATGQAAISGEGTFYFPVKGIAQ